jgi:lambda repressor-like predicted transcriptional regulator
MLKKIILPTMGVLLVLGLAFSASAVFASPIENVTASARTEGDPPPEELFYLNSPDWFAIAANIVGLDEDTLWERMDEGKSIAEIGAEAGVSSDQIIAAIIKAEENYTKELLADGKTSQEEIDEWMAYLPEEAKSFVEDAWCYDLDDGDDWYAITADALQMDEETFWNALDTGVSIADLAAERGIELNLIHDAIMATEEDFLAQLVADGEFSQEEIDELREELRADVTFFLNESWDWTEIEGVDWIGLAIDALKMDEDAFWMGIDDGKSIADLAKENDIPAEQIAETIIAAEQASIQELLAENVISQDEADEWLVSLKEDVLAFLSESWDTYEGTDWFAIAAETLKTDEDTFWQALEAGKSLAQLAEEQGVSTKTLQTALVTAEKDFVNELLTAEEISQDEADEWLNELDEDVQLFINETWE